MVGTSDDNERSLELHKIVLSCFLKTDDIKQQ